MTAWDLELAATKVTPPAPPGRLVSRSRLHEVLDRGADGPARLVLVSAPAGSGKSTLVASWLARRSDAAAWLQVEVGDADPARFWSYLLDAIDLVRPIGAGLRPMAVSAAGDAAPLVSALVNALARVAEPLLVVIDDYHLLDDESVHRGLERLIDLCPSQVTVILATRVDPPFRLSRLRVRATLVEVRAADLRFEGEEAADLLGPTATGLGVDRLEQLCERTEGWAAGLVLAGLSLGRVADPDAFVEAFRGDDQLVVEYLHDELLGGMAPKDRRRLLETSVLDGMCGALIDAVTGGDDGGAWLAAMAAENQLLIRLDTTGTWFRYHHLLRDLLRIEAAEALATELPELHSRAAAWLEAKGDLRLAVGHRLSAGERQQAAELLTALGPRLLAEGASGTLRRLLDELGEVAERHSWSALLYGWCEYLSGRYDLSDGWLDIALEVASDDFDHVLARTVRMNNALARGDVNTALVLAKDVVANDEIPTHACTLAAVTGAALAWAGQADEARPILRHAVERAVDEQIYAVHATVLAYLAVVELEAGSREAAHAAASAAVTVAEGLGLSTYHGVAPAYAIRARTVNDRDRALADARFALQVARRSSTQLALGFVLTACGDTLIDHGEAEGTSLLSEARGVLGRCVDPGVAGRYLARVQARHQIAPSSVPAAPGLVEQLTVRELAVLRYLAGPLSQREIAAELFVSLNTVKTHSAAIYRKLGVTDRKAAVHAARTPHVPDSTSAVVGRGQRDRSG